MRFANLIKKFVVVTPDDVGKKMYEQKRTHLLELISIMTSSDDIEMVKANYTATGVEATIIDKFDDQKYKVVLEPVREKE